MKLNYLNHTKNRLKALLAGLFLFGTFATQAQCLANFTYALGANGSVTLTSTSAGTTISTAYFWGFSASPSLGGSSTTHTYSTNGYKYICLTITSSSASPSPCTNTKCDSILITNITPTATPCSANFNFVSGANGSVNFLSTSSGTTSNTYYSWYFGDSGYGSGLAPNHTYAANGTYVTCLTIIDSLANCSSTKCDTVIVANVPPAPCVANFYSMLGANGSVSFVNTSTGTSATTNYSWNFGDSSYGSGTGPSHTYSSNGIKYVCLTITDSISNCNSTVCDTLNITSVGGGTVSPCTHSVMYTLSKDSVTALTWNAYPYYPAGITNATWSWGDGTSTTGLYPSHTYSAAGTYSTCVTVSVSCDSITSTYCYVAAIFRSSESNAMILLNVKQAVPTGIKNLVKAGDQLSIYPNPNNGEFVVELNSAANELKESTVSIYNMVGEKVFEKHVLTNGKQTVDVSNLANGTYLVKINSDAGYINKKITIQK